MALTTPVTPQSVHHSWIQILLQILEIAAAVAPAAAAPFAPPDTEKIITTESGLAGTIAGILAGNTQPPPAGD